MQSDIPIAEAYRLTFPAQQQSQGVEGYQVQKVYVDPAKLIEQRQLTTGKGAKPKKKETKRGSYLEDQAKVHKIVPGPGKYKFCQLWPQKKKTKSRYAQKITYIGQIIKRQKKEKRPPPGHYKIFKSLKEIEAENKKLAAVKKKPSDRLSFLDTLQFEAASKPGVGNYNVRIRSKTETSFSKHRTKPEDMRKKHAEQNKKKMPTRPDQTTYSPNPANYTLFSTMSKSNNKNWLGRSTRFKATKSCQGLNPTRYSLLQQWPSKGKKISRHGLDVLSKQRAHTSVYY